MPKIKIRNMDDFTKSAVFQSTISKYFYDPKSIRESIKQKLNFHWINMIIIQMFMQ